MCLNPQTNKFGNIYACGKCDQCHNMYIRHWTFRLQQQQRITPRCCFLTLTYDYNSIPFHKTKFTLLKKDYQDFLKRLRKHYPNRDIKYVLCGEYGEKKKRPHYHAILFDIDKQDVNEVQTIWGKGSIHMGDVSPASIAYVFKYAIKSALKTPVHYHQLPPFVAMSQGLGESFAFDINYKKYTGIDKNGNNFVRYSKERKIKPHFQRKLDTLLKMPYYMLNTSVGMVKMSIPKFYLRAANYDCSELGEMYASVISRKFHLLTREQFDVMCQRSIVQRADSVMQQTKNRQYTISKEKF